MRSLAVTARKEFENNQNDDTATDDDEMEEEEEPNSSVMIMEQVEQLGTRSKPVSKRRKIEGANWSILENIWPESERPIGALRDRDWIEKQSIGDLMSLQKAMTKKEMKEQGQNICKAKRDSKPVLATLCSRS